MSRAIALVLLAALGGCATLRPAPAPDTLRLSLVAAVSPAPRRAGVIALDPAQAIGMTAGRRYVYVTRTEPQLLRQAATLFWEVPPAQALDRAIDAAIGARYAATAGAPDLGRLSLRLTRFEEVTGDGHAEAVVATDAALVAADGKMRTTGRYCQVAPIPDSSSSARAAAFQIALAALSAGVADDLAAGRLSSAGC